MTCRRLARAALLLLPLTACMVGPDYHRPASVGSLAPFKEAPPGWTTAAPSDTAAKGDWWAIYNDPLLDRLEATIVLSNQTVKQFQAQYNEAKATVDVARSALFPVLGATASDVRSSEGGFGGGVSGVSGTGGSGRNTLTSFTVEGTASWDLDVWGRIRRQVESDVAAAQVSAADLANGALSAQGALATDYFDLRYQDSLGQVLNDTVKAYADALRITRNQYNAGTTSLANVAAAETQLDTAQAALVNVGVLRAQYEHAIAVLTGVSPSELSIPTAPLASDVPVPPAILPSTLLERRPDIAAAERAMQQENALIGVQIAAYYPDISLSALYGYSGNPLGSLIQTANRVWSLGATATQALFEGGLRNSAVAVARASYDNQVATYRQTVLTAFQQVEDELVALRVLAQQAQAETIAVNAAQLSVKLALNQYLAGTVPYTTVITEQTALLTNQESALAVQQARLVASVTLVQALGGGFTTADLPSRNSLQKGLPFLKY